MIYTNFSRRNYRVCCDGCNTMIEANAPSYEIILGAEPRNAMGELMVCLCEDCGMHLQNDMSDEFCEFLDMGE